MVTRKIKDKFIAPAQQTEASTRTPHRSRRLVLGDNAYRILCRQSAESDRVPRRFQSMSGGAPTRNLRPAIAQKDYY